MTNNQIQILSFVKFRIYLFSLLFVTAWATYGQLANPIDGAKLLTRNGEIRKDTDGNVINAHGAGILYHEGTYYLFGEIKKGKTWLVPGQSWECYRVSASGVSCYS